jgi:hypothetical protein
MDFHIKTDTTDDETWPLVPKSSERR